MVHENAFDYVWKPPVVEGRMDSSSDYRVERDLEDGAQIFNALLAER